MATVKSGITNSPFVGVTNVHLAEMLTDPADGTATYEEAFAYPWIIEVKIQPQNNQETLYADNMSVAVANATSRYDLSINMAGVPLEYRAKLLGHKFENGKMVVSKEDAAPYFAFCFESTKQNGKKRFVRFTKVQFTEPDETSHTKEEKISYNTPTMTATAVYRTSDGISLEQADEESDGYSDTIGNEWYDSTKFVTPTKSQGSGSGTP